MNHKDGNMGHDERLKLVPGDRVMVQTDRDGVIEYEVKYAPWQLGHGAWVIGLKGVAGGYDLNRVVGKVVA